MKRNIRKLTTWKQYEKKLLQDKNFVKAAEQVEYEYTLAKSLIKLRQKFHLSQAELAKKAGTKQPVISRIETGAVKPSLSLLERIAAACNVQLKVSFQ